MDTRDGDGRRFDMDGHGRGRGRVSVGQSESPTQVVPSSPVPSSVNYQYWYTATPSSGVVQGMPCEHASRLLGFCVALNLVGLR